MRPSDLLPLLAATGVLAFPFFKTGFHMSFTATVT